MLNGNGERYRIEPIGSGPTGWAIERDEICAIGRLDTRLRLDGENDAGAF